ncbi:ankyrin repeat and SOCS box protein [Verticillium alfalfae VaMs.102]|uniref:Ankyrin repeat and SOCS box protein n=1 Tax=Verticillium alfalfae (strain VaMs.102 / ATCC MYA-4576 / FGSC 10136) TaxID=526221 RepID=C9SYW8_VERA1|nr:ankyrin repeat and SOCS box protein [Verticillium alfalfae VaMs.102]EEY23983.1 ankyrin repeat and SOCS box protein [Verticillium alfalfae VaMs.102]
MATMAAVHSGPSKPKDSVLDLCTRSTLLGNNISVRMLEFLTTVKHQPHGFRELAESFLDVCRHLWSIEAGLAEASRTNQDWRMMFADKEISKMRDSLRKIRDALRMSALVFQWSLGNGKTDESVGGGYASLAEALDRMKNKQGAGTVRISKAKSFEAQTANHSLKALPSPQPPLPALPALPSLSHAPHLRAHSPFEKMSAPDFVLAESGRSLTPEARRRASISNRSQKSTSDLGAAAYGIARTTDARGIDRRHVAQDDLTISEVGQYDLPSRPAYSSRLGRDDATISDHGHYEAPPSRISERRLQIGLGREQHDSGMALTVGSNEDPLYDLRSIETGNTSPTKIIRLKADPMNMPRWTPRHSTTSTTSLKSALAAAVHSKNHKLVEQLLDRGISPETGPDIHILVDAVLALDAESVRLLLLFGADPNTADKEGVTPLFAAVEVSAIEIARTLLKYGADANLSAGPGLESPLATAVIDHKYEFVQLLLTYGGDPNHIMANGNTVLIISMSKNTPKRLVDLMLDYGSDPNEKNREGKTALFEAIFAARPDLVTALLDHGANPNLPGPKHMLWPASYQPECLKLLLARGADSKKAPGSMELAVSINNIESVRLLLAAGVDPNLKKDGIYTPLCTAIRDNRHDILALLLANKADPNLMASEYPAFKALTPTRCSEEGHTPLTTAIAGNRPELVDELIAHGANPSVRGQDWPICMAVRHPDMLKKLLPSVSDPRAFKGLVERAVVANQLESVKLLLAAGVSVEDRNGGVFSPLTTAIREDNKEITRYLLEEGGADINAPGEHLPIVKAVRRCRGDDTDIIEMLLAKGADVNKIYRGWNAVMQAVENGDAKVLRLLVELGGGADMDAQDEGGRNILEIAAGRGWEEPARTILEKYPRV